MAIGAIRALRDLEYRVPEDVSVIGFDGTALAEYYNPKLATIKQQYQTPVSYTHLQNLALTAGEPSNNSQMLALNIFDTFYGRNGWEGVGQAKAVIFFIIVAVIALAQNRLTRSKEVQQ